MFRDKAKKIALLVDNCPAHPDVSNLTNVKFVFLPPWRYNTHASPKYDIRKNIVSKAIKLTRG